jgi:hypothetical protein
MNNTGIQMTSISERNENGSGEHFSFFHAISIRKKPDST